MDARTLGLLVTTALAAAGLAGCTTGEPAPAAVTHGVIASNVDTFLPADALEFTGTFERGEVGYGVEDFEMDVPEGTIGIHAVATWTPEDARVDLRLQTPGGATTSGRTEMPGIARIATVHAPDAGTWTVRVVTDSDSPVTFTVRAWTLDATPTDARIDERIGLAPGEAAEVNLVLEEGATLQWAFVSEDAVAFDVHSHQGQTVVTHAKGQAHEKSGAFTAPSTGIYSFFAQGADGAAATFEYALQGAIRLHSRSIQ